MKATSFALAALGLTIAAPASADVVASGDGGFATRDTITIPASPAEVWDTLVRPALYWNPEHSWYGSADQLFLTFGPGGCFCEIVSGTPEDAIEDLAFVEHARVIRTASGQMLRLSGAFGPLQGEALTGTLTIELDAEGAGTRVEWSYVVAGFSRFSLPEIAPVVDMVMSEQLGRLGTAVAARAGNAEGGAVQP
ncbi:ATPase [Erythrobacter arachoides]|uniref:ATPase n=1 Tax=Aurantiacibacter arachoides TaxID=1850444 RepID=A0A844ZXB5_9SPHN|nr:SRPBCC family protein [Aurantiacibacter arachoides]MXO92743.1 ATPase [Aurantiacibacter arachoides]